MLESQDKAEVNSATLGLRA